jgi:alpha-ribazole phosphatase
LDLYLVRHTRPDIADGLCYGRLDPALPDSFDTDARRVEARLPRADRVITDDSLRCHRLASILAGSPAHAQPSGLIVDPRLRELDFGHWEGQDWNDIPRAQTDAWADDMWNRAPPGGESYAALHARVLDAWEALLRLEDEVLIVVAPIGPLRALITIALELPVAAFLRVNLDYGGITQLSDHSGGWRLEFANR